MTNITINLARQTLTLHGENGARVYEVSAAKNGAGELNGSNKTPRGLHIVKAKIGEGAKPNTVFRGRRPTGETYSSALAAKQPGRDWILTRILWLGGCERGKNRGGNVDTLRRFIYIHGSPDEVKMGEPGSIGCIRMRNDDVVELFNAVAVGAKVLIQE